jgi:nitrate reductase NapE component
VSTYCIATNNEVHPKHTRSFTMRLFSGIAFPILAVASAAYGASWGFEDATLTVQEKGAGVGGGVKEK